MEKYMPGQSVEFLSNILKRFTLDLAICPHLSEILSFCSTQIDTQIPVQCLLKWTFDPSKGYDDCARVAAEVQPTKDQTEKQEQVQQVQPVEQIQPQPVELVETIEVIEIIDPVVTVDTVDTLVNKDIQVTLKPETEQVHILLEEELAMESKTSTNPPPPLENKKDEETKFIQFVDQIFLQKWSTRVKSLLDSGKSTCLSRPSTHVQPNCQPNGQPNGQHDLLTNFFERIALGLDTEKDSIRVQLDTLEKKFKQPKKLFGPKPMQEGEYLKQRTELQESLDSLIQEEVQVIESMTEQIRLFLLQERNQMIPQSPFVEMYHVEKPTAEETTWLQSLPEYPEGSKDQEKVVVDFSRHLNECYDQKNSGTGQPSSHGVSCAITSLKEWQEWRNQHSFQLLSTDYIETLVRENKGIHHVLTRLQKQGMPTQVAFQQFEEKKESHRVSARAALLSNCARHRVDQIYQIKTRTQLQQALQTCGPCLLRVPVPMQDFDWNLFLIHKTLAPTIHTVLIVGMDDDGVLIRNSLGTKWKERGYVRIPLSFIVCDQDQVHSHLNILALSDGPLERPWCLHHVPIVSQRDREREREPTPSIPIIPTVPTVPSHPSSIPIMNKTAVLSLSSDLLSSKTLLPSTEVAYWKGQARYWEQRNKETSKAASKASNVTSTVGSKISRNRR
jgi:hypothetical protein